MTVQGVVPGRVVLGRAGRRRLAARARESILVLGPTQSGKTTGLAAPALRDWPGPAVATSVKRDLVDLTGGRPDPVWIFDPSSPTSARWSPLEGCSDWRRAQQVASWLVSAARPAGTDRDGFWYQSAAKLLAPVLLAAAVEGCDMGWVAETVDARRFKPVHDTLAGQHPASRPSRRSWPETTGKCRLWWPRWRRPCSASLTPSSPPPPPPASSPPAGCSPSRGPCTSSPPSMSKTG
jgi:hypothetical protein